MNSFYTKDNKNQNYTSKSDFDKIAHSALESYIFLERNKKIEKNNNSKIKVNQISYNNTFKDIETFSQKFQDNDKKKFNSIIYHGKNSDGICSAYSAWKYLTDTNGLDMDLHLIPITNARNINLIKKQEDKLKDRYVILFDLEFDDEILNYIKSIAKGFLNFPGHGKPKIETDTFVDKLHAPCSLSWKFFYPKQEVPKVIQYIDYSDAKLFSANVDLSNKYPFSAYFNTAFSIRITNNFQLKTSDRIATDGNENSMMYKIDQIIQNKDTNFLIFIGRYMEEIKDNIKDEIANNAGLVNFQGYKVGVLNFDSPALAKVVGRQIISNFKAKGVHIDFSVVWAYHYTKQAYRVQLIDDHKQTKINLRDIAIPLSKIGGSKDKGGGHPHIANFYWAKDIKLLFTKNYLK